MGRSSSSVSKRSQGTEGSTNGHGSNVLSHEYVKERLGVNLNVKEQRRNQLLITKYGITRGQFEKMLLIQRGKCGICDRFFYGTRRMFLDHDHKGNHRVRGILCYSCNKRLLGRGLEDPELHERAAAYLRSTFDGRKLGLNYDKET